MSYYAYKFEPILKERLWGGTKLGSVLNKPIEGDTIGESWEISAVPGDISTVSNGTAAGKNLQELISADPQALLGESVVKRFGEEFPILIKFIDAKKDLSIQLHPDDKLARERHNSFGKTEMWYVMDADQGAELIVGFNRDLDQETYKAHLEAGTLTELMNYEVVEPGDTFFINTGKVHAIGAGVLLAEIQQTSDVTYRIYDFDRRDKDGNLRELHTDLALEAIDYKKKDDFKVHYPQESNALNPMVRCPYFNTNFLHLTRDRHFDLSDRDSFTIYMCVEGSVDLVAGEERTPLKRGESALVPAAVKEVTLESSGVKLLEVSI